MTSDVGKRLLEHNAGKNKIHERPKALAADLF
ncbi:MAG: hypothetical protein AB7K37_07380 [Cyclobacteriaceae bacterium]